MTSTHVGADREHALVVDPEITTVVHSTSTDRDFLVRVVRQGERYGLDDCLLNDSDTTVEFYDLTYADDGAKPYSFGPRGQFVSRYYLRTLLQRDAGLGLLLHGAEPNAWALDAAAVAVSVEFAKRIDT